MIRYMSETPEPRTAPTTVDTTPAKPFWLYRFAAWVAVVAGIVFIAGVIFFSGAVLTHHGHYGHHGHKCHHKSHPAMMHKSHKHHRTGGGAGTATPGPGQPPRSVMPSTTTPTP